MPFKDVVLSQPARVRVARGVDTLANAVKVTLGPRGRNVVLQRAWGAPLVTKDGVTVANEIELRDPFANMGAQMVKEVASKTGDDAGDGTTTATVLAQAIFNEGLALVAARHNPIALKRGIDAAVENVVAQLAKLSKPLKTHAEIAQVGTISANGEREIGEMIALAMDKVGREGVITIEPHNATTTELDVVEGLRFDRGYVSPQFVTDDHLECVLEDPFILVYESKIGALADFVPLLEQVIAAGRPLLVVADKIEGEALSALVINKLRGALRCCAVEPPGYGSIRKEEIQDLAAFVGAKAIMDGMGVSLAEVKLADLGRAKRVTIGIDQTTIFRGRGSRDMIDGRLALINAAIAKSNSDWDKLKLRERLAKLSGGVALIKVGATTELAMKEKKARIEDALSATRAAIEEGLAPGGGVAYVRCLDGLAKLKFDDARQYGVATVRLALEAPLRQIARNAGADPSVVVQKVRAGKGAFGFNAETDAFEDLLKAGVIDPTKVLRAALQNAASVAGLLLTTEAVMIERDKIEFVRGSHPQGSSLADRGPETNDFKEDDD
ncbi:MAG TPA: chaperonin GroEL [Polyangia bacterium]|nr:chaperonin GroEL [Polyangia bacterium]